MDFVRYFGRPGMIKCGHVSDPKTNRYLYKKEYLRLDYSIFPDCSLPTLYEKKNLQLVSGFDSDRNDTVSSLYVDQYLLAGKFDSIFDWINLAFLVLVILIGGLIAWQLVISLKPDRTLKILDWIESRKVNFWGSVTILQFDFYRGPPGYSIFPGWLKGAILTRFS